MTCGFSPRCPYPAGDLSRVYCNFHHRVMSAPPEFREKHFPDVWSKNEGLSGSAQGYAAETASAEEAKRAFAVEDAVLVKTQGTLAGQLLRHAADIVDGNRNQKHGNKERSFLGIAKAWKRIFGWDCKGSDVARAMIALKEQRMVYGDQSPEVQKEHVEDILGYWAIYYELRRAEG